MNEQLKELEEKISYHFQDKHLLAQALTHSSYANEHRLDHNHCNERLEFLGDAVLEIVTSDFLYHKYTEKPEGDLTKIRASIVCEPTLAYCAEAINLGSYLFLGKGEDATGGRNRNSVVSDAMEAVIGAIYLDGGFASAKEFILKFVMTDLDDKQLFYDSKTILQEVVQAEGKEVEYDLISEKGPEHDKVFEVTASASGMFEVGGKGHTKKAAQQQAAYNALLYLKKKGVDINLKGKK